MRNLSTSVPYLFLIVAFPFFKMKKDIKRPFVFYKNIKVAWGVSAFVWLVVAVGITFTCIEPLSQHQYMTTFWTAIRPLFFGLVG